MAARAPRDELGVEWVPIDTIRPYPGNPRRNERAVEKVVASLKEFGWRQPIVVDKAGVIVAGHTRHLAAIAMSMPGQIATVPIHRATNLSAAQIKAYRLADNRTGEEAEWNEELLAIELKDLQGMKFDLGLTGFDFAEIDALLTPIDESEAKSRIPPKFELPLWRQFAGELLQQLHTLDGQATVRHMPSRYFGVTPAYAAWRFLQAKFDGRDYPRQCSLAFHPQQLGTNGEGRSVLDGLQLVVDGKIKPERLQFACGGIMDGMAFSTGRLAFAGARMPLDFPASLARDLVDEFAGKGAAVLDPCAGWGGRIVGFLLSKASSYRGVDVSPLQVEGNLRLWEELKRYAPGKRVNIDCVAYEDWRYRMPFDFALTSPPYFDTEQYQGGEQSHTRYANYGEWRDGFYAALIKRTLMWLRPGATFALQIGSQRYPLLEDGKRLAIAAGFKVKGVRDTDMVNGQMQTVGDRAECILLLKKPK